ncbi:unnamed protein product [Oikopleura dioica]|uniref:EGF-like domain-containing protein n=1 Tax=Oikopleura dioica TaxID=34765 RepID=E4XU81_OIKDI|nr:unnamed protein product [Oikopleura dioica]
MKLFDFLALLAVCIEAGKAKKAAKKVSAAENSEIIIDDDTKLEVPNKKSKWASKQEKKKSKKSSEDFSENSEDEPGCVKKGKCENGKKATKNSGESKKEIEDSDQIEIVSEPDSERNIGDIFSHLLGVDVDDGEVPKPTKKPVTFKNPKATATTKAQNKPSKWSGNRQNGKDKNSGQDKKKNNEKSDNDTRTVDVAESIIEKIPEPPKPTTKWDVFRRIKSNLSPLIPTTQPELTTYVPYGNEARELLHAVLNSDEVALPCINDDHQCNELATCFSDPLSKKGYACKCKAGYRGHGKKNLPVVWGTDVEPTNEMFWITIAEQVSLVPELTSAFGLNDDNSRTIGDISDRVRNMVVAGKEGMEEGLWFLKESMIFTANEIQGCVDIDECYEETKPVNANKPRLCKQTEYCKNTDGGYKCENDFSKFCALGLHNCHALADCLPVLNATDITQDPRNSTGFLCQCKLGFTSAKGTAHVDDQCLDINECEDFGLDLCPSADFRCFNTIGSFECVQKSPTAHPDDFDLYPVYTLVENITPTAKPTTLPDTLPLCEQQDPLVIQLQAEQEQIQIASDYWNNQKEKANQRGLGTYLDEPCQDDTCGFNGNCVPRSILTPWESLCICDAGFSGHRCEINLISGGAAAGARYRNGIKTCQEIKVYPGDKGTIEIFAKENKLYDLACFRFITRPQSNTALHFRFGNDGGCAYNKDLPKCARYQSYWLALDNGADEVDNKRLIEYQSQAWKWICESDNDPHFLGGHMHFIEKERSSITLIYQPTAMSVMREAVRLDYEADIDECTLGIHECHVEAHCYNKLKGDSTYDFRGYDCICKKGWIGDGFVMCINEYFQDALSAIINERIPPLLNRLNILSNEIASTLLNMRAVKYDFYRDEVVPKQEVEEEKARVQNDAIAELETDSKGFLEGNTQSINKAEGSSAAANQTYEEKIAELSGTYEIVGSLIDDWGDSSVSARESALASLLGLTGATRKRRQDYPDDPAKQLDYHNQVKIDMFSIAEAKLEGAKSEIILVSPEVLEHENAMKNLLDEIDVTKLWLAVIKLLTSLKYNYF